MPRRDSSSRSKGTTRPAVPPTKPTRKTTTSRSKPARPASTKDSPTRTTGAKPPTARAQRAPGATSRTNAARTTTRGKAEPTRTARRPKVTGRALPPSKRRLTQVEANRLLHLEDALAGRIVGKREAIERISRVIRVRLTQLDLRPERPKGIFLLVGPHGVGKSEIAYAVTEAVYGSEEPVTLLDLGEFEDEEQLSRLGSVVINTPEPVLVEGALTTPVRQNPQTVFLLRGLEHAHPGLQRILLSLFERGSFEDMIGPAAFRDAIFFLTVTFRREDSVPAGIGFSRASRAPRELLRERLERLVLPDLLDAFDDIVELPALTAEQVRKIARYKVDKVLARMQRQKKAIAVDEAVFESLIPDDLCRTQGAAFLNRTLEDRLFNPLARYLLSHRKSAALQVGLESGQVTIHEVAATRGRRPR